MPVAPRWLDLNPVAPWEVNQEPDPVRSDLPAWHPGLVHRAAWGHLGPAHRQELEHQGQVHPATWGRPVAAWDHPATWERLGRVHQAALEHPVEPGRRPGQDHPAAWEHHLGLVHPVALGHLVAVLDRLGAWVHLGERDHLGEWVQAAWGRPVAGRVHPAEEDGRQVVNAIHKGVGKAVEIRLPTPFFGEVVDGLRLLGGTTYIDAELTKTQDGINRTTRCRSSHSHSTSMVNGTSAPGTPLNPRTRNPSQSCEHRECSGQQRLVREFVCRSDLCQRLANFPALGDV
jgi:hypothetical protein